MASNVKKWSAEFLGTFWLTFGGCGSAVLAAAFPNVGIGLLGVSFAFGLTVQGGCLENLAFHVEDHDAAVEEERVRDDIAHALACPGGCHDKAMREFLEGGAYIRRGLGRGPELAEDHPRPQGLQKSICLHLRARLEFGLPIFGELLAEG